MGAPGKSFREGISIMQLADMFPSEESAVAWFEKSRWPEGRRCPYCGGEETFENPGRKPMPYRCRSCQEYFGTRTGTVIENSRLPVKKWVWAIYLFVTSLKGVSSMKLHRDLDVTQKTAWFMLQRLRESWADTDLDVFTGPSEVDETYFGGREGNKHKSKKLNRGRGTVGKSPVVGIKDRKTGQVWAQTITDADSATLHAFVEHHTETGSAVYTDDASAYKGLKNRKHGTVKHSVGEYVIGEVHTQGIESLWSMMKRAHKGTYHKMSPKHLQRYVMEFSGRHNMRTKDTIDMMASLVAGAIGKQLPYKKLIADNGLPSMARS